MLKNNIYASVTALAFACFFSFICMTVSGLSALLPFALMVTFAVCGAVCEKEYASVSGALSVLVSYLLCSDVIALYTAIVSVAAGIVLGYMIKKQKSVMSLTVASAVGLVALYAIYIFVFAKMNGYGTLDELFDIFAQSMVQTVSAVDATKAEAANMAARMFRDLFPSIVIISSAAMGYFVVFITGVVLSFRKNTARTDMGFSKLRADRVTTVVFIVSMIVTIFSDYGIVGIIAENIYTILMFVLQVCGLSLLDWILKNVSRMNLLFRIIIIFFVFSIQILSVLLIMAAIIDARRNFRGLSC